VNPFTRQVRVPPGELLEIRKICEDPAIDKVFHNYKFDRRMLASIGVRVAGRVDDTFVAMHCLRSHEQHGLKEVCKRYLEIDDRDERELQRATTRGRRIGKRRGWALASSVKGDYWAADHKILKKYAMLDVQRTVELWKNIEPLLDKEGVRDIYELEMALLPITYEMETHGMALKVDIVEEEIQHYTKLRNQWLLEIQEEAGEMFNPNSSHHMRELLFDKLKLAPRHFTASGLPSTDKDTLREFDDPLVIKIRNFRVAEKAVATLEGYKRFATKGVLHPDFQQLGAHTGRFSCKYPNLQNVGRGHQEDEQVIALNARRPFGPPDGKIWYAFDFDQIEARLLAHLCGDETLIDAFLTGKDVHTQMALRIWGDAEYRQKAKQVVYATVYGGGKEVIAKKFGITAREARKVINEFHRSAPDIKKYATKLEAEAEEHGFIRTLGGRKVWAQRGITYPMLNYKIQGSAADQMKMALLRVYGLLPELSQNTVIVSTVHDELILQADAVLPKEETERIKEVMSITWKEVRVPLTVGASVIRKSWADKESV